MNKDDGLMFSDRASELIVLVTLLETCRQMLIVVLCSISWFLSMSKLITLVILCLFIAHFAVPFILL